MITKHPLAIVVPPMPQGTSWLEVDAPDGQVIRLPLPEGVLQGSTIYVEYIPRAHAGGVAADPTQPPVVQARPILRPPEGMAEQAAVAYFKCLDDFKKKHPKHRRIILATSAHKTIEEQNNTALFFSTIFVHGKEN